MNRHCWRNSVRFSPFHVVQCFLSREGRKPLGPLLASCTKHRRTFACLMPPEIILNLIFAAEWNNTATGAMHASLKSPEYFSCPKSSRNFLETVKKLKIDIPLLPAGKWQTFSPQLITGERNKTYRTRTNCGKYCAAWQRLKCWATFPAICGWRRALAQLQNEAFFLPFDSTTEIDRKLKDFNCLFWYDMMQKRLRLRGNNRYFFRN